MFYDLSFLQLNTYGYRALYCWMFVNLLTDQKCRTDVLRLTFKFD